MTLGRTIKGVYVDYAEYIFSQGHAPRGRGGWAFFWDRSCPAEDARWHIGTLQEACKAAADEARAAGVTHVWVGS